MTKARRDFGRRVAFLPAGALLAALFVGVLVPAGCGGSAGEAGPSATPAQAHSPGASPRVTFVELGSDKCIPCKEMRPVMDAVQASFGDQLEIVFYDVGEDPTPANEYGVQMIPTQVFLDEDGEEFHRHVGFYPQAGIEALLIDQGLTKLRP